MSAASGAAAGAAAGAGAGIWAGLPAAAITAVLGGVAGALPFLLTSEGAPSEEEQERMLRRQLEIQDEFEQRKVARDMGGIEGLVGGGGMSLADLIREEQMTRDLSNVGYSLNKFARARSAGSELDDLLLGQTAKIAQLQSQRVLTPLEVIQMVESQFG